MIRKVFVVASVGAFALAGQAVAASAGVAQLDGVKGQVTVSKDGRLTPAKAGALKAGDRVVAGKGEARLAYADGCVVVVKPQSMATIAAASPCASGGGLVQASAGASAQGYDNPTAMQVVGGTLAVGGLLYGLISIAGNNHDGPVSQ